MIVIIKVSRINRERCSVRGRVEGNVQEARLLATCLTKGGSQRWLGSLETFHAHHGGSNNAGRFQKKFNVRICAI